MKRVLIVDDSTVLQKVLRVYLAGLECEFHIASSGREALETARRVRPDIIISDIYMPDGSGIELCRTIRATASLRRVPVLLISAHNDPMTRQQVAQSGAEAFLTKPIDSQRLFELVSQLLQPAAARTA